MNEDQWLFLCGGEKLSVIWIEKKYTKKIACNDINVSDHLIPVFLFPHFSLQASAHFSFKVMDHLVHFTSLIPQNVS